LHDGSNVSVGSVSQKFEQKHGQGLIAFQNHAWN